MDEEGREQWTRGEKGDYKEKVVDERQKKVMKREKRRSVDNGKQSSKANPFHDSNILLSLFIHIALNLYRRGVILIKSL